MFLRLIIQTSIIIKINNINNNNRILTRTKHFYAIVKTHNVSNHIVNAFRMGNFVPKNVDANPAKIKLIVNKEISLCKLLNHLIKLYIVHVKRLNVIKNIAHAMPQVLSAVNIVLAKIVLIVKKIMIWIFKYTKAISNKIIETCRCHKR